MKVAFLQDFFEDEIIGGAEQNDSGLRHYLEDSGVQIKAVHTYMIDLVIECYDFFIVSNFVRLSENAKRYLIDKQNYIIYEHDHKYVSNRNPGAFANFLAPQHKIINRELYANARKVFVLSNVCKEVMEQNLKIDNVHSIGCSLWSPEKLSVIEAAMNTKKQHQYGVLNSTNAVKGTQQALKFCEQNSIQPYEVGSNDYSTFISQLSHCENFIFFPQVLETYSRVCAEAKMLNCKIVTTPKLVGFFSEEYSSLAGQPLVDQIRSKMDAALNEFRNTIIL